MSFEDQFDLSRTTEGQALSSGWRTFVQTQKLRDVFWDPTDYRWETYPAIKFTFSRTALKRQDPATVWSETLFLGEVLAVSKVVRASGGSAIWSPRDGYWYKYWLKTTRPQGDGGGNSGDQWMERLNRELAAVERNSSLSPEEKHRARLAIIDSYT